MKCRLLDVLVCPGCRDPRLDLEIFETDTTKVPHEIESGVLRCKRCASVYPIVGGIPRMLPDSAQEHAAFLDRFPSMQAVRRGADFKELSNFHQAHDATRDAFTFEWLRYSVTNFDENYRFFKESTGLDPAGLAGHTVLEAGCGMGRFMEVAASSGAIVVGIDLSRSVERARAITKFPRRMDFVQGDITHPPFKLESFDVVYSIGVLHHTPDAKHAFRAIAPLVRPGGRMSVWVYRTFQPERRVSQVKRIFARMEEGCSNGVRVFTTRLPHIALHWLCALLVPLGYLKYLADTNKTLKYVLAPVRLLPISPHREWRVRLCDTFDWLAPRFQWKHTTSEVVQWFREEGFEGVGPVQRTVSVTGVRPAPIPVEVRGGPYSSEVLPVYAGQQN